MEILKDISILIEQTKERKLLLTVHLNQEINFLKQFDKKMHKNRIKKLKARLSELIIYELQLKFLADKYKIDVIN